MSSASSLPFGTPHIFPADKPGDFGAKSLVEDLVQIAGIGPSRAVFLLQHPPQRCPRRFHDMDDKKSFATPCRGDTILCPLPGLSDPTLQPLQDSSLLVALDISPFPGLRRLASDRTQRLWMSIAGSSSGDA